MAAVARRDLQSEIAELQEIKAATANHIKQQDSQIEANEKILSDQKQEAEEVYKPFIDAQERLMAQYKALTPKQQAKERTILDMLEKSGRIFGSKNPKEIREVTEALKKESDRLESEYLPIEDDDDFER